MPQRCRQAAGLLPAAVEEIKKLRAEWATLKDSDLLQKKSSSSKKPHNNNKKEWSSLGNYEVLRGIVALVEVSSERRAVPLRATLRALGATVVLHWNPFVTHVIWGKGGDRQTRAAARALAARVVSPLWVEACAASNRRLPEKAYPAAPRPSDVPSPLTLLKLLKETEIMTATNPPDRAKNKPVTPVYDVDSDDSDEDVRHNPTKNKYLRLVYGSSSFARAAGPSRDENGNMAMDKHEANKSSGSKRHSAVTCPADSSSTTDEEVGVNKRPRCALPRSLSSSGDCSVLKVNPERSSSLSRQDQELRNRPMSRHLSLENLGTSGDRNNVERKTSSSSSSSAVKPISDLDSPITIVDDSSDENKPVLPAASSSYGLGSRNIVTIVIDDDEEETNGKVESENIKSGGRSQCKAKDKSHPDRVPLPGTSPNAPKPSTAQTEKPSTAGPSAGCANKLPDFKVMGESTAMQETLPSKNVDKPGTSHSTSDSRAVPGLSNIRTSHVAIKIPDPAHGYSRRLGFCAITGRSVAVPGCSGAILGRSAPSSGRYVSVQSSSTFPGRIVPVTSTETMMALDDLRIPRNNIRPRNSAALSIVPQSRHRLPRDHADQNRPPAPSQDTVYSADGRLRIVLTGMSRDERKRALDAMANLRGAQYQRTVNYKTTHVVIGLFGQDLERADAGHATGHAGGLSSPLRSSYPASAAHRSDDERSVRTLSAIAGAARGCRVVSSDWLYDSEAANRWLSYRPYAIPEFRDTAEKAFLERHAYDMMHKDYAYNIFYGRRVRLSQVVENRKACEHLLILCGAVVMDENGVIRHNADLDLDEFEPEAEDSGPLPDSIRRRIGPFLDARFGRPPQINGINQNRSHSLDGTQQNDLHGDHRNPERPESPRRAPNRVAPRNLEISTSKNAKRLLWRGHDRIRFSEVKIGARFGQVSSKWVFDSVTHGRMHSIRRYIPIGPG